MTPIPEPACDIRAQIAAMLDVSHPKQAVLIVPGNEDLLPDLPTPLGVYRVDTPAGVLLTRSMWRAGAVENAPTDKVMAWVLGYPEDKDAVVAACCGNHVHDAIAVQARDIEGSVIIEAFASPGMRQHTVDTLLPHVPEGGALVIMTPISAISRRIALREAERAHG